MKQRIPKIPIIDLFAGPGGLGEGFSSCESINGKRFKIQLSVEKDIYAHQTLRLRAFFRQFAETSLPEQYYKAISRSGDNDVIADLYRKYPEEFDRADAEARNWTLGKDNGLIHSRILQIVTNQNEYDHWVLIGGPPCQAYSLAGRVRNKGKQDYLAEEDERNFLYREYLKIIALYHPSVFIMENVKGILSADINGKLIFNKIREDLTNPNLQYDHHSGKKTEYILYSLVQSADEESSFSIIPTEPRDFIIKSEEYGIPQKRHRVIILGVRKDMIGKPEILQKKEKVHANRVLKGLPRLRSNVSGKGQKHYSDWLACLKSFPDLTDTDFFNPPSMLNDIVKEIEAVRNFPDTFLETEEVVGRNNVYEGDESDFYRLDWYRKEGLAPIVNHVARSHMAEDLHRYLFAACYAKVEKRSPRLRDFPRILLPKHKNVSANGDKTIFNDRFRVQLGNEAATTITSHISKDGHYYIHPDPEQNRAFTVREAARLQTFPDDYFFCGPRTSQYHQVGNAVPPLLANQIAGIVLKLLTEN